MMTRIHAIPIVLLCVALIFVALSKRSGSADHTECEKTLKVTQDAVESMSEAAFKWKDVAEKALDDGKTCLRLLQVLNGNQDTKGREL